MNKIWMLAALLPSMAFGQEAKLTDAQLMATPQCHCQTQCEAMWAAAPDAIEDASSMRVRMANDTMIDTYVPRTAGYLHGRAIKTPGQSGGYAFVATFDSRPELPDLYVTATNIFNIKVNTAGATTKCPAG
jgi:hypothetical protein